MAGIRVGTGRGPSLNTEPPTPELQQNVQNTTSQRVDARNFLTLQAAINSMSAGQTLDLAGLTWNVTSSVNFNVAGITVQNGTITNTTAGNPAAIISAANVTFRWVMVNASYAFGTNWTVSSSSLSALNVNAASFKAYDCAFAGGYLACVFLGNANCNGSKLVRCTTTQTNLAQNSCGIQVGGGNAGNLDITIEDCDVIGAGGAYNSGNPAAGWGIIMFDCKRGVVRNCRVRNCTRMPTLTISNGNGTSHGSTALWTLVSGTIWQARIASGTPGVSGPQTDRPDGGTTIVKLNGTQIQLNTVSPTSPSAGQWGLSGGFIYYNTSGQSFTDPNNEAFTSDVTSGYGITFYNTTNNFNDMSENVVEGNQVYTTDGFGIYMQLGPGPAAGQYCYGTGNRTSNNVLENCCLQGIQDVGLPYGAMGWNGGTDSIAEGDTIRNSGSATGAPGFTCAANVYLSSARVIGVTVDGAAYTQGFSHNCDGGWTYLGCEAKNTSSYGFYAFTTNSQTIRNLSYVACRTVSCATGMYMNGTASSSTLTVNITGGSHKLASNASIRIDTGSDCTVMGVESYAPNQSVGGQPHFWANGGTRVSFVANHFVSGPSGTIGVDINNSAADCTVMGNTGGGVTTFLSIASGIVVRIGGNDAATATPGDYMGAGVPTSGGLNFSASAGSTFRNTSGSAGSLFYVNTSTGSGNTWTALA